MCQLFRLHEIASPLSPDPEMEICKNHFPNLWDQVIGHRETPINGYKNGMLASGQSCWGRHIAKAICKEVGASVGMNVSGFLGVGKGPGPVTFGDIVDNLPHIRKYGDQGWEIATICMSGWKLRPLMAWANRRGYSVDFSGLGYLDVPRYESIKDKANYRIAFPSEMAVAINGSLLLACDD